MDPLHCNAITQRPCADCALTDQLSEIRTLLRDIWRVRQQLVGIRAELTEVGESVGASKRDAATGRLMEALQKAAEMIAIQARDVEQIAVGHARKP